jgi:hypothetical protein
MTVRPPQTECRCLASFLAQAVMMLATKLQELMFESAKKNAAMERRMNDLEQQVAIQAKLMAECEKKASDNEWELVALRAALDEARKVNSTHEENLKIVSMRIDRLWDGVDTAAQVKAQVNSCVETLTQLCDDVKEHEAMLSPQELDLRVVQWVALNMEKPIPTTIGQCGGGSSYGADYPFCNTYKGLHRYQILDENEVEVCQKCMDRLKQATTEYRRVVDRDAERPMCDTPGCREMSAVTYMIKDALPLHLCFNCHDRAESSSTPEVPYPPSSYFRKSISWMRKGCCDSGKSCRTHYRGCNIWVLTNRHDKNMCIQCLENGPLL